MVVWQLPGPFDLALTNQVADVYGEHLSMFATGMLLFTTVLGADYPAMPRTSIRGQVGAIIAAGCAATSPCCRH
jgi:cytochrome c oxidase assembly factor CtaG